MLRELNDRFRAYHGEYFSIVTDARPEEVAEFRKSADETYAAVQAFAAYLDFALRSPGRKLPVIVFAQWRDYQSWAGRAGIEADQALPGFFDERTNRCVLFDYANLPLIKAKREELASMREDLRSAATATGGSPGMTTDQVRDMQDHIHRIETRLALFEALVNQTVVRHEIAHQVLCSLGVIRPGDGRFWLKEGLALQFETNSGLQHNQHRLNDFFADDANASLANVRSLIGDPQRLTVGADRLPEAYASAGVLAAYLISRSSATFVGYLRSASARADAVPERQARIAEFEAAFGPLDRDFELQFRGFVEGLRQGLGKAGDADQAGEWTQRKELQP
ncbi:MAG TPA: DUF1570 domain-containing protein [Phycisphaerae bacterium]|nr:DUF1570 domain-containing protein [Phycisphaerae bacterium]